MTAVDPQPMVAMFLSIIAVGHQQIVHIKVVAVDAPPHASDFLVAQSVVCVISRDGVGAVDVVVVFTINSVAVISGIVAINYGDCNVRHVEQTVFVVVVFVGGLDAGK